MNNFILRGLNATGDEFFYTGRAGDGWVSRQVGEAFGYATVEAARCKATMFNKTNWAHCLLFTAVPANFQEVA